VRQARDVHVEELAREELRRELGAGRMVYRRGVEYLSVVVYIAPVSYTIPTLDMRAEMKNSKNC
jgi:hypothetical protein